MFVGNKTFYIAKVIENIATKEKSAINKDLSSQSIVSILGPLLKQVAQRSNTHREHPGQYNFLISDTTASPSGPR